MRNRDEVTVALLAAAERLLDESGLDGLSVRSISNAADLSTMNVYSRFGNVNGLLDQLAVDGFKQLISTFGTAAPTGDAISDLIGFARLYRSWVMAHPGRYRLMMTQWRTDYQLSPEVADARRGLLNSIAELVEAARAIRVDPVAPFSAEEAATVVLSILHGAMMLELDEVLPASDSTAWAERCATAIRFGLGPQTGNAA